jgi:uncharacterized protein YlxW (UPF0749 family)
MLSSSRFMTRNAAISQSTAASNNEGFRELQGAKNAGLRAALAQINETLRRLEQARKEAEAAVDRARSQSKETELER